MANLIETFKEGWLDEDPRLVAAVLLGIATFVILSILLHKSGKRKAELKQQAIEKGNVIEGHLSYHRFRQNSKDSTPYYARYKYTVNGVTKEYSINSNATPPDTIKLYPKNSSMNKFFSDYDRTGNAGIAFNGIMGIVVCIVILWVTGYIF